MGDLTGWIEQDAPKMAGCDFPRDSIELDPENLRLDWYTHNKDIQSSSIIFFDFFVS